MAYLIWLAINNTPLFKIGNNSMLPDHSFPLYSFFSYDQEECHLRFLDFYIHCVMILWS
jgi:hypothetical protein